MSIYDLFLVLPLYFLLGLFGPVSTRWIRWQKPTRVKLPVAVLCIILWPITSMVEFYDWYKSRRV